MFGAWLDIYAAVMLVAESGCYRVCMLILFRCASEDSRGSRGLQVCRSEVETNIYTGNFACGVGIYFFLFVIKQIIHTDKEGRVLKPVKDRLVVG